MKKFLLAVALLFSFSTSFAAVIELEGSIVDIDDQKEKKDLIKNVDVKVGNLKAVKSDNEGFTIEDFVPPTAGNSVLLDLEHPDYIGIAGAITIDPNKTNGDLLYGGDIPIIKTTDKNNNTIYTFDAPLEMRKKGELLFRGVVYVETKDGDAVLFKDAEISVSGGKFAGFSEDEVSQTPVTGKTDQNGEFVVYGYFSDEKDKNGKIKEIPYTVTVAGKGKVYKKEDKIVPVKDKKVKEVQQIILRELTSTGAREKNLTAITGFKCNELMPKYLVGANCVENSTLEGDATDLAVWIYPVK